MNTEPKAGERPALTEADAKADLKGEPRPDFPKNLPAPEPDPSRPVLTEADAKADLAGKPRPTKVKPSTAKRFNRVAKRVEKAQAAKKSRPAAPLPPPPVQRSRGRPEVTPWFDFDKHNPYYAGRYDVRLRAFPTFVGRAEWDGRNFRCEGLVLKKSDIAAWRGRSQP